MKVIAPPPQSRFTILDSFSNDHLGAVLGDSGVDMTNASEARELISLIRSKELAQAALARAAVARVAVQVGDVGTSSPVVAQPDQG